MRRALDHHQPLDCTRVGKAESAYVSVGPWLFRSPFDRVIAVATFTPVSIEFAVGSVAPSHILSHYGVSACDGLSEGFVLAKSRFFVVWRSIDERRKSAGVSGKQNIRSQYNAVAHWNCDFFRHDVRLSFGNWRRLREGNPGA